MEKLELSIIIVNYKSADFTAALIKNISQIVKNINYEIIVVNNEPDGDADKKLREEFAWQKKIKFIQAEKNLGFGAGNNLGSKSAAGEYLLFLNPDIQILDDSIEKMLDFAAKHSEIGALSPLLYQKDAKTLQRHFYGEFQNFAVLTIKRWKNRLPSPDEDFFYVDTVSGAAMMVGRDIFQRLGGFDQNFFMYFEDDDLCRRLSKSGYKNTVLATARLIHFEGQSSTSEEKKKYYYQSQDYYWQKHYGSFLTTIMKLLRYPYIVWQKII